MCGNDVKRYAFVLHSGLVNKEELAFLNPGGNARLKRAVRQILL